MRDERAHRPDFDALQTRISAGRAKAGPYGSRERDALLLIGWDIRITDKQIVRVAGKTGQITARHMDLEIALIGNVDAEVGGQMSRRDQLIAGQRAVQLDDRETAADNRRAFLKKGKAVGKRSEDQHGGQRDAPAPGMFFEEADNQKADGSQKQDIAEEERQD